MIPWVQSQLTADTVLKIGFPSGIEWVGTTFYFDVADNFGIAGFHQGYCLAVLVLTAEYPVPVASGFEVLLLYPSGSLVGMASFRPLP